MTRIARILAGLAILLAVGWSLFWTVARTDFDTAVDTTVRAFEAAGIDVEIGARRVTGFPFAMTAELDDVVLRDPSTGHVAHLPRLESGIDLTRPGDVVTRLPERFRLEIPVGPAAVAALPDVGGRLAVNVAAEDLTVIASGSETGAGRLALAGDRVRLTPANALAAVDFLLDIEGLDAKLEPPASADRPAAITASARRTHVTARSMAAGVAHQLELSLGTQKLEATSSTARSDVLERIFRGAPEGWAEAALQLASVDGRLEIVGGETSGEDGTLTFAAGRLDAQSRFEAGTLSASAALAALEAVLLPAETTRFPGGGFEGGPWRISLEGPAGPSEAMRPLRLEADLETLAPDRALWSALDPKEALTRDPLALTLVLDGSARFLADPRSMPAGAAPPVELGNLSLETLSLAGLGATARASGDIEFVQPIQQPHGLIAVELDGALGLIRSLHRAGLIDEQTVQTLATFAAFYTRAGDGPDLLRVDLGFDGRGLTVNGEPFEPIR